MSQLIMASGGKMMIDDVDDDCGILVDFPGHKHLSVSH